MTTRPLRHARPSAMLWLIVGFGIWGSAFLALYGLHALGCAYQWGAIWIRIVLGVVLFAHVAALFAALGIARRDGWADADDGVILAKVAVWTLWAAIVATLATFGPSLVLTVCA